MQNKLSVKLADTIMARFPHPDNFPYISWCYCQGFMLNGFIRLYEATGEVKYRDYVLKFADFHVAPDGSMYRFTGCSMDDMMSGSVIVWAWKETGEERYRKACDLILSKFKDYPRLSNGGYEHGSTWKGQMWVDGVFMGGMFLSHYGAYVGKTEECFKELVFQLDALHDCCHKKDGLLYHAWSDGNNAPWANRYTGKSTDVWSEGLGWYVMMLAETVRLMPDGMEGKDHIAERLAEILNTLSKLQSKENGLFYQVVDKIDNADNWTDTSGSAMFAYAFATAIRLNVGDVKLYEAVLEKAWAGIQSKSRENEQGLIDVYDACDGVCVQNNYDAYIDYPRVPNAKEAVGAVLWISELMDWRMQRA